MTDMTLYYGVAMTSHDYDTCQVKAKGGGIWLRVDAGKFHMLATIVGINAMTRNSAVYRV